jgi:hypothetical protein
MLVADGGGGYGGTSWYDKDVPAMWDAIADQQTEPHWEVLRGWKRTAELTDTHMSRVMRYRTDLAAAWPPEKSPASAAYIARLDDLIAHLQETYLAASANYSAFSAVTSTLDIARTKVEKIHQEYAANQARIDQWQSAKKAAATPPPASDGRPTPSPQASPVPTTPPISPAHQEQLNNQARAIMYDLSNTILNGGSKLQEPKLYMPTRDKFDTHPPGGDAENSNPSLPPVLPYPGTTGGGLDATDSHGVIPPSTATQTSPHSPTVTGGGGPLLTGTHQPVVSPTPVPPTPTNPGLPGGNLNIIAPPSPPILPPGNPLPLGTGKLPGGGMLKQGLAIAPGGRIGVLPPSGVIGEVPRGMGPAPISGRMVNGVIGGMGQPSVPTGQARVNPVGGVISSPSAGRGTRVGGGANMMGQGGAMAGRAGRSRRGSAGDVPQWDPDNPWATEEGVEPVLLPPEEVGPIDPGPAIGIPQ